MRTLPWLDDFLFSARAACTLDQARALRDHSFALFERLGLQRAEGKGQAEPEEDKTR